MTFRIMAFNIRGAVPHRDGPNAWEHRAPLTLSLIERTTPDLIGFQEFMICLYIQETGNFPLLDIVKYLWYISH